MADFGSGAPPKMGPELQSAIRDDALYKARNDAKFRALSQHVDYETFKNMVSVAHLRPLQAPNTRGDAHRPPAWSFDLDGAPPAAASAAAAEAAAPPAPLAAPATGLEFERAWRPLPPRDRVAYLRLIPADAFPSLFKVEVSHVVLGELLTALSDDWRSLAPPDAPAAVAAAAAAAVLASVARAGRFALTSRLLGAAGRAAGARLFDALAAEAAPDVAAAAELARVRKLYAV